MTLKIGVVHNIMKCSIYSKVSSVVQATLKLLGQSPVVPAIVICKLWHLTMRLCHSIRDDWAILWRTAFCQALPCVVGSRQPVHPYTWIGVKNVKALLFNPPQRSSSVALKSTGLAFPCNILEFSDPYIREAHMPHILKIGTTLQVSHFATSSSQAANTLLSIFSDPPSIW